MEVGRLKRTLLISGFILYSPIRCVLNETVFCLSLFALSSVHVKFDISNGPAEFTTNVSEYCLQHRTQNNSPQFFRQVTLLADIVDTLYTYSHIGLVYYNNFIEIFVNAFVI